MRNLILKRKILICMLFIAATMLGYLSLQRLPVELFPNTELPFLIVQVYSYQETDPQYLESEAIIPLEGAVGTLEGIDRIESRVNRSSGTITVFFNQSTRLKYAYLKLREKVTAVMATLPEYYRVNVVHIDTEQISNMFMGLQIRGGGGLDRLRHLAEREIKREFEAVDGIASVQLYGGREMSVEIVLDEAVCAAFGVTPAQVAGLIRSNGATNSFAGQAREAGRQYFVNVVTEYTDIHDLENIIVRTAGPVRLGDVAEINFGVKEQTSISRVNGKDILSMNLVREARVNLIDLSHKTRAVIDRLNDDLAARDVQISIEHDAAEMMEDNIDLIVKLALIGGGLAVLLLWFFLRNLRLVLIIALAIPISVYAAFNFFYAFGISINTMTLVGIALAVGMLLDNSVVVLENIYRLVSRRKDADTAVMQGVGEIWRAIVASTLTTVAVFLPFIFSQEFFTRILGKHIGVSIISTLLISLAVSLLLVPMVAHWFLRKREQRREQKLEQRRADEKVYTCTLAAGERGPNEATSFQFFGGDNRLMEIYTVLLKTCLRHPARTILSSVVLFFISVIVCVGLSVNTTDEAEDNHFNIYLTMPAGASLNTTDETVMELEQQLADLPEMEDLTVRIEEGSATLHVSLKENYSRIQQRTFGGVRQAAMNRVEDLRTGQVSLQQPGFHGGGGGFGGGGPDDDEMASLFGIGGQREQVIIKGNDFDRMRAFAEDLQYHLERVPAVSSVSLNVQRPSPEIHLLFNQLAMSNRDVAMATVAQELRGFQSEFSTRVDFRQGVDNYDIVIRSESAGERAAAEAAELAWRAAQRRTAVEDSLEAARAENEEYLGEANNGQVVVDEADSTVYSGASGADSVDVGHADSLAGLVTPDSAQIVAGMADSTVYPGTLVDSPIDSSEAALAAGDSVTAVADSLAADADTVAAVITQMRPGFSGRSSGAKNIDDLRQLPIPTPQGGAVELQYLTRIVYASGNPGINRVNQEKQIELTFDFRREINDSRGARDDARAEVDRLVAGLTVPPGLAVEVEHGDQDLGEFKFLIGTAFLLIFMILASVFESLTKPLVMMFTIPLAGIGSFWILILTKTPLMNAYTLIGFLILLGVVVNNGIILIDYALVLRRRGVRTTRALMMAGQARLRPILITAITTIAAMVPLAMGKTEEVMIIGAPFAITVIGGLAVGTLFTLIFIPVVFHGLDQTLAWLRALNWRTKLVQLVALVLGIWLVRWRVDSLVWRMLWWTVLVMAVPGLTWFIRSSLRRADAEIIPEGEPIRIRVRNLTKIYDQPSQFKREWGKGPAWREKLRVLQGKVEDVLAGPGRYHRLRDFNQWVWQVPLVGFAVYFIYFYLRSNFWLFVLSHLVFFLGLWLLRPVQQYLKHRAGIVDATPEEQAAAWKEKSEAAWEQAAARRREQQRKRQERRDRARRQRPWWHPLRVLLAVVKLPWRVLKLLWWVVKWIGRRLWWLIKLPWRAARWLVRERFVNVRRLPGRTRRGFVRSLVGLFMWGFPLWSLMLFAGRGFKPGGLVFIALLWYGALLTWRGAERLHVRRIKVSRISGRGAGLRKAFYRLVQVIPVIGKKKRPFLALGGVSLEIGRGMLGLLGPNGAGKTTMMRIICGVLEQSYGRVYINGIDTRQKREELQGLIGYLPQEFGTYENMTAWEFLNYQAILKKLTDKKRRERMVDYVLRSVNIEEHKDRKIGSFSGGMKQRVGIAQILLALPRILVVDEPTAGLDPRERIRFRNLLVELSRERVVIFSTHIIEDIYSSCKQVAVLNEGRLLYLDEPLKMTAQAEGHVWQFFMEAEEFETARKELRVVHHMRDGERIRVRCLAEAEPVVGAELVQPTLEDAYLWLLGRRPETEVA